MFKKLQKCFNVTPFKSDEELGRVELFLVLTPVWLECIV